MDCSYNWTCVHKYFIVSYIPRLNASPELSLFFIPNLYNLILDLNWIRFMKSKPFFIEWLSICRLNHRVRFPWNTAMRCGSSSIFSTYLFVKWSLFIWPVSSRVVCLTKLWIEAWNWVVYLTCWIAWRCFASTIVRFS